MVQNDVNSSQARTACCGLHFRCSVL